MKNLWLSCSAQQLDETIFSSGASRITEPDELNEIIEIVQ